MRHDALRNGKCRACRKLIANSGPQCHGRPLTNRERGQVAQWNAAAWQLASRHSLKQHADVEDDAQEAALQMCMSARTYDPGKGVSIGTHLYNGALWRVLSAYRVRLCRGLSGLSHQVHKGGRVEEVPVVDSLQRPMAGGFRVEDTLEGESSEWNDMAEPLWQALGALDGRSRHVVLERFFYGRTLAQVGRDIGVCRERVRQIEDAAIASLRGMLAGVA